MILASDIRKKYLDFFAEKNHAILPSAPLIPENDPSVLFNTAGMQPLVPYLLGQPHPLGTCLADVQKCIRTNDIDEVGDDTHLTFFEMLGNWSLGDYFKQESIAMSYEFLTSPRWLGLNPKMLSVTVFEGNENAPRDEESAQIWKSLGIPESKIAYLGAEDNWWAAGATGPCGPDTEIFYYMGEGEPPENSNKRTDDALWMEIWNNVFMQYNRVDEQTLHELPAKCVDTGMGIERCTVVLNRLESVYDTDLFLPVLKTIEKIVTPKEYRPQSGRIIADHIRAATHMIADGVVPKNIDQGYILRRLIRRAIREAYKMNYEAPFIVDIANIYITQFTPLYESIAANVEKIRSELQKEEGKFHKTLKEGERVFNKVITSLAAEEKKTGKKITQIDGKKAFNLFDTYGFPLEMTQELAREHGLSVDEKGFQVAFQQHQVTSRTAAAGKFRGGLADTSEATTKLHSACHLLLAALRQVLGEGVHQAGSNITAERLRLDFSHDTKMTEEEKKAVEDLVNTAIQTGFCVFNVEMLKEEARAKKVEGSFWEKYPDKVKVYIMKASDGKVFSQELCGGPHVESSENMGTFRIVKEEASSAGVRRIKAVLE